MNVKKTLFHCFIAVVCSFCFAVTTHAADPKPTIKDEGYTARFVSQSHREPVQIAAGETITVTFKFKNAGTETWNASGARYISAYTMEERYRKSPFANSTWEKPSQTTAITKTTKPGEIAELSVQFTAPSQPGEYVERFYLAAENYSWMNKGYFFLKLKVTPPKVVVKTESTAARADAPKEKELQLKTGIAAKRTILSKRRAKVRGNEEIKLSVGFQNVGDEAWEGVGLSVERPVIENEEATFAHDDWLGHTLVLDSEKVIEPGERFTNKITLRAPHKKGSYKAVIRPVVDGEPIGTGAVIRITVTDNAPFGYRAPRFEAQQELELETPRLASEPYIRVGIWKNPEENVRFRALTDAYDIYNGDVKAAEVRKGASVTLLFDKEKGTYSAKERRTTLFKDAPFIRLIPKTDPHALFKFVNHKREYQNDNYNTYHGRAEYRSTQNGEDRYMINEVLFDDYVEGIGETSNAAPIEFIKANLVAARTYAYVIQKSDKHDKRNFDVVAHTGDQLYLGAEREEWTPNVVKAAAATRGYMITYKGDVVVTPYFGNTAGRTLSWKEKWGGDRPWLQSVKAHYDARDGKRLFGHGVGMSQRDAAIRADEEGSTWRELLKYYYTDIKIQKMYL